MLTQCELRELSCVVRASDGYTYDAFALQQWMYYNRHNGCCHIIPGCVIRFVECDILHIARRIVSTIVHAMTCIRRTFALLTFIVKSRASTTPCACDLATRDIRASYACEDMRKVIRPPSRTPVAGGRQTKPHAVRIPSARSAFVPFRRVARAV